MTTTELLKQHLIDPEICIRCNTCEETCPVDAVTHDGNNYVVDASICNHCMDCISPCPTGSIDNWRVVTKAYSLEEQYSWEELPKQEEVAAVAVGEGGAIEALEDEQTAVNRMVLQVEHPTAGPVRMLDAPIRLSATPAEVRRVPPRLGALRVASVVGGCRTPTSSRSRAGP